MSITIGNLYRNRTVRNLNGTIREMVDEANGGVIISGGRVVNQERMQELIAKEKDKNTAATEATQVSAPIATVEQRTVQPNKIQELESKVNSMEGSLAQILELLQKK